MGGWDSSFRKAPYSVHRPLGHMLQHPFHFTLPKPTAKGQDVEPGRQATFQFPFLTPRPTNHPGAGQCLGIPGLGTRMCLQFIALPKETLSTQSLAVVFGLGLLDEWQVLAP